MVAMQSSNSPLWAMGTTACRCVRRPRPRHALCGAGARGRSTQSPGARRGRDARSYKLWARCARAQAKPRYHMQAATRSISAAAAAGIVDFGRNAWARSQERRGVTTAKGEQSAPPLAVGAGRLAAALLLGHRLGLGLRRPRRLTPALPPCPCGCSTPPRPLPPHQAPCLLRQHCPRPLARAAARGGRRRGGASRGPSRRAEETPTAARRRGSRPSCRVGGTRARGTRR